MPLSKSDSQFIKSAFRSLNEARSAKQSFRTESKKYSLTKRKAANLYKQGLLETVLKHANVKVDTIKRRQNVNDAADQKFIKAMKTRVTAYSKDAAKRQKAFLQNFRRIHRSGSSGGNGGGGGGDGGGGGGGGQGGGGAMPTIYGLGVPDHLNVYPLLPPNVTLDWAPSEWNNVLRVWIQGGEFTSFNVDIGFLWTAPQDGNLSLVTALAANGSNWWASQHACVESLGEQSVGVGFGTIDQITDSVSIAGAATLLYHYWDDAGCADDAGINVIEEYPILSSTTSTAQPVVAGQQLLVVVSFQFEFWKDESLGDIDFYNSGKAIGIPGVLLSLA